MSSEHFQRVEHLFKSARLMPPADRPAFLTQVCAGDTVLRHEVESLLTFDADAGTALDEPVVSAEQLAQVADAAIEPGGVPDRIGRYRILGVLGQGGMGIVYDAEQDVPRRRVALKVLRAAFPSAGLTRRFEHEIQALGRLQHPGIAQIHEAGAARIGGQSCMYFAMELIDGQTLTEFARSGSLDVSQRVDLVARVCEAVHFAHAHGVIHRDLKPANILVDAAGQPKVLDFGVARVTGSDGAATTLQTGAGQIVGTILYMSPEQVEADPRGPDARTDVYALGVVLFELLAGRLPQELGSSSLPEAARLIREEDPARLSSIDRKFHGDLDTIVARALEKERSRRYASAAELAADLRRYLRDEPIHARPASRWYQLRKFARRNRGLVTGLGAALLTLVAGLVVTTLLVFREAHQRRIAVTEQRRAAWQAYVANIANASLSLETASPFAAARRLAACPEPLRDWEWRYLHRRLDESERIIRGHFGDVSAVAFSPDDLLLLSAGADRTVRLWNARDGTPLATLTDDTDRIRNAIFSPDGTRILTGGWDAKLRVWDVAARKELATLPGLADRVRSFFYSPDGTRIHGQISRNPQSVSTVAVWDATSFQKIGGFDLPLGDWIFSTPSPDGRQAFIGGVVPNTDGCVIDLTTGHEVRRLKGATSTTYASAWSHDGSHVAAGSRDRRIYVWNARTAALEFVLRGHAANVASVEWSPGDDAIISAAEDGTIRLWNAHTGQPLRTLLGHSASVLSVAVSRDGRRLVSGGADSTIRLWNLTREAHPVLRGHTSYVYCAAFSPDGVWLATGAWDRTVRIWHVPSLTCAAVISLGTAIGAVAWSPDGRRLAAHATLQPEIQVWDVATIVRTAIRSPTLAPDDSRPVSLNPAHRQQTLRPRGNRQDLADTSIAWSPDGRMLAALASDGEITVWDGVDLTPRSTWTGAASAASAMAFSRDGSLLAVATQAAGGTSGAIECWDPRSGTRIRSWHDEGGTLALAFSSDGIRVAAGGAGQMVHLYDAKDGSVVASLAGHVGKVYTVVFSLDGSRIFTGGEDGSLRIWDARTGDQMLELHDHANYVKGLALSPDGSTLASASGDTTVRLWRSLSESTAAASRPIPDD